MAVKAIPPQIAPKYFILFLKLKEKAILVRYCIIAPTEKAIITERNMPKMMANALEELINSLTVLPSLFIKTTMDAIPTDAPSNSNTIETVVEVGRPTVLYTSSRITSVIITARNMNMICSKVNIPGFIIPLRATSIMPLEKTAPNKTPIAATAMITLKEATLEPIAEFKKLTASLLTPTMRSDAANKKRIKTIAKYIVSNILYFLDYNCKK